MTCGQNEYGFYGVGRGCGGCTPYNCAGSRTPRLEPLACILHSEFWLPAIWWVGSQGVRMRGEAVRLGTVLGAIH